MLGLRLKKFEKDVCKRERLVGAYLSQSQPIHKPKNTISTTAAKPPGGVLTLARRPQ